MTRYPKNEKTKRWTSLELNAIPVEWTGDILSDGGGLSGTVRMKADGSASIRFQYIFRIGKKTALFQCGSYPANDMATIRSNRDDARDLVSKGIDPRTKKQADKIQAQNIVDDVIQNAKSKEAQLIVEINKNKNVADLYHQWVVTLNHSDGNKSITQLFNKHILPRLGNTPIKNLGESHISDLYKAIVDAGKYRTAVLTSKAIVQMFKWAEKRQPYREILLVQNPADLVKLKTPTGYTNIRDRVLSIDEIIKLNTIFNGIELNFKNSTAKHGVERPIKKEVQLAMWICLSTICRIGELLMAEWKQVDFDKRTWSIPKANTKGATGKQSDQLVYLSDFTLKQFKQLDDLTGKTRWLFPARYNEGHVCIKSASKQIGDRQVSFKQRTKKLKDRVENNSLVLGEREWTPHDLRRTGATMMQELKVSNNVIHLCQNHATGNEVERAYLHYQFKDEKADAWDKLGNRIQAILSADNVMQLR